MMYQLDKIFQRSMKIPINDQTKMVIMSDCHRGAGDNYDNFVKNQNIFEAALLHYYQNGFTYIELGDGDDMWEVKNYSDIIDGHLKTFQLLKKFYDDSRFIMIYGNHDICKKSKKVLQKCFYQYFNHITKKEDKLLDQLQVHESLVLNYKDYEIFMIHGHQASLLNSTFWRLSKFLVRYIWKTLEHIGLKDPTGAAKNYRVTKRAEKKLEKWSIKNNKILIAGHTHRPIFPKIGHSLYFNDGSCIHPSGITAIEIENGNITLVKWQFVLKDKNLISVGREVLAGGEAIIHFFS